MAFADLVEAADRAALEHLGGEAVTYHPESGAAVEVTGIFDAAFVLAEGTAEAGVGTTAPAVFLRREDLPVDPEDDEPTITIDGTDYRMVGPPRTAGLGSILLVLRAIT